MKVQSIPAQITTVEDKIAGSLSLAQIFLLMIPVFWTMVVYTFLYPYMQFSLYKIFLTLIVGIISVILSIRVKEKIIFNWLVILIRYNARPRFYVFNKNDSSTRFLDVIPSNEKSERSISKITNMKAVKKTSTDLALGDLVRLERILSNPSISFSIKSQKKGALYVAIEQKQ